MDRTSVRNLIAALLLASAGISLVACTDYESRKAAYFAKGNTLFEAGDDVRARLELKNALQIDHKYPEVWYLLGRIEERAENFQKAFRNYSRAVELDPDLVEARARKALLLIAANELDAADPEIEAALAQAPEHPDVLVAHGKLRQRRGDASGAEADARAALRAAPNHVAAVVLLATAQVDRKAMGEAVATLRNAIKANPREVNLQLLLGQLYDEQGDTSGATEVLERLVGQFPEDQRFRVRLANYYASLGRNEDAEANFREAVAEAPDDLARQRSLLEFLLRTRGVAAAQAELTIMLQRNVNAIQLRFIEADLLQAAGDLVGVESVYRKIIEGAQDASPDAIRARNALARLLLDAKQYQEASGLIEAVLQQSPREPDALEVRALLALRNNDAAQAISDLRSVLDDDPTHATAQRMLALAHAQREEFALAQDAFEQAIRLAPTDPLAYLQLAEVRVRGGDNDGAVTTLEQLLDRVPDDAAAQQAIARIQLSEQDWKALRQTAARIKADRPEHPLGYYLEGLILQRQDEHREAVALFDKALELRPDATEPLVAQARSHLALDVSGEAKRSVNRVLERNPNNLVAINLLGEIYLATGAIDEAMTTFQEAVRFHRKSPRAYVRLAQLQLTQGDVAAARDTLDKGIEETERNGFLLLQQALLLTQTEEREAAIHAYEEVLRRFPDTLLAVNNLAVLLAISGADQVALDRAQELAGQLRNAEVPEFMDTVGWVHYQRGEYDLALPYLEKGVAGKPDLAELRYHLGMNLLKLGQVERAKEHLAVAVSSSAKFQGWTEAQQALRELRAGG